MCVCALEKVCVCILMLFVSLCWLGYVALECAGFINELQQGEVILRMD